VYVVVYNTRFHHEISVAYVPSERQEETTSVCVIKNSFSRRRHENTHFARSVARQPERATMCRDKAAGA
jgi:hypothetical protein